MLPVLGFAALAAFFTPWVVAAGSDGALNDVRQIAIIGAGAAGSSTAYHLRRFAEEAGVALNISIFEKTGRVGGRTLTVDAYGDPLEKVELGASIFISQNHILYNASRYFSLPLKEPYGDADNLMVVWDGETFLYQQSSGSYWWWDIAKLFWKYGIAPYRAQKLMQSTVAAFLRLYEAPHFPFRSLTIRAFDLGLARVTGFTGEQFLRDNNIGELYSHDIIQAATRVNYASNLGRIHGLDTMVSLAPEGAVSVFGGNWRIFDRMVAESGAAIYLNTSVSSISLADQKPGSARAKYIIKPRGGDSTAKSEDPTGGIAFDDVVLATPYQFSDLAIDAETEDAIDEIPYVKLHVTLFASPFRLSAGFFNLPPGAKVPTTALTTLAPGDNATSGAAGAGKAGFFSVSTLRKATNPRTGREEYLYKVFSPTALTPEWLSSLLGVEVPETFTGRVEGGEADVAEPISWHYPHVFHSYPKAYPRVTFQDPILRQGLYYTSGIESLISTMETSALMGMNVARLIVDDALGLESGGPVLRKKPVSVPDDDGQRPLGQGGEQRVLKASEEL